VAGKHHPAEHRQAPEGWCIKVEGIVVPRVFHTNVPKHFLARFATESLIRCSLSGGTHRRWYIAPIG
jgi:hypothetical protein